MAYTITFDDTTLLEYKAAGTQPTLPVLMIDQRQTTLPLCQRRLVLTSSEERHDRSDHLGEKCRGQGTCRASIKIGQQRYRLFAIEWRVDVGTCQFKESRQLVSHEGTLDLEITDVFQLPCKSRKRHGVIGKYADGIHPLIDHAVGYTTHSLFILASIVMQGCGAIGAIPVKTNFMGMVWLQPT